MSLLRSRRTGRSQDETSLLDGTQSLLNDSTTSSKAWRPRGELSSKHWLVTVAALAVVYGLVVLQDRRMPDVQPADQYEQFSEVRARSVLNQLTALGPRPSGSTNLEVSCAIMMEVMEVLSKRRTELENDVIFLFNGAEENFLQGSHGFITQHPWRHHVRAFINMEGTGSGGREILFQAGPGDSWILKTYLDNAPHPHCSVVAQEIFQSGIIPSDTDFRVFRDYAKVSGLDIAYHRNGWVYHTEFDRAEVINTGAVQRAGENVLAVTQALVRSPRLAEPDNFAEGNQYVFFDVVGLHTVFYEVKSGNLFNLVVVSLALGMVLFRFVHRIYTPLDLLAAFVHNVLAFLVMLVTGLLVVGLVHLNDLVMCWYSTPELVFPVYIVPMIIAGCWTHSIISERMKASGLNALSQELIHYDSVLLFWSGILLFMTYKGLASSFFILIHVLFPLFRDPLTHIYLKLARKPLTPQCVLFTQWICLLPVIAFVSYAVMLFFDFFVPVMGRMGNVINPEAIMMPLSLVTAWTFVLFTSNLVYVSRRMDFMLKGSVAVFLLAFAIIATTSIGVPYKWSEDGLPRLRRILALHAKRSIYNFEGELQRSDSGLFVQSFDYRGVNDLPSHFLLQSETVPDCSQTKDEYCQLPYYTAIHEVIPPSTARFISVPEQPRLPYPLNLTLVSKSQQGRQLNMTFVVEGGVDKMSLHVTPLNGYNLKQWSFTPLNHDTFGRRGTYFVFLSYGHERPDNRTFWVVLEPSDPSQQVLNTDKTPHLELAVATHYAHGPHQNSVNLLQLRAQINARRRTPQAAVGYWKWAIVMIGGSAELVARVF